jgi:hypothetical protein
MQRLESFMKVQLIVFALYALGWFFIPGVVNDTILGWDSGTFWPRMIGGAFFGVVYLEWRVIQRLHNRLDLVWAFVMIPLGFLAALLIERATGGYTGNNLFWWVSVVVTAFFGFGLAAVRMTENY